MAAASQGMIPIERVESEPAAHTWQRMLSLVLDSVSSPHTRRAYRDALEEFALWCRLDSGRPFTRATVLKYRSELQEEGLAPSSINVRLSAIRKLAQEAADNGLLRPDIAGPIVRL